MWRLCVGLSWAHLLPCFEFPEIDVAAFGVDSAARRVNCLFPRQFHEQRIGAAVRQAKAVRDIPAGARAVAQAIENAGHVLGDVDVSHRVGAACWGCCQRLQKSALRLLREEGTDRDRVWLMVADGISRAATPSGTSDSRVFCESVDSSCMAFFKGKRIDTSI